jgi:hypothetical protein
MSDTPETDALAVKAGITITNTLIWNFARKLELERNEAKINLALALIPTTISAVEREEWRQERDQLRKVCDELAAIPLKWPNITWDDSTEHALSIYNSLPHVTERNKAK